MAFCVVRGAGYYPSHPLSRRAGCVDQEQGSAEDGAVLDGAELPGVDGDSEGAVGPVGGWEAGVEAGDGTFAVDADAGEFARGYAGRDNRDDDFAVAPGP